MNTVTIKGERFILVPAAEYRELVRTPTLPPADRDGNRDAIAYAEASIARNVVRRRQALGWSQKELAERAGIRVEILNRIERGKVVASVRTLTRIEAAFVRGEKKTKKAGTLKGRRVAD